MIHGKAPIPAGDWLVTVGVVALVVCVWGIAALMLLRGVVP
mgnify:CR=1 FL=1